jgi:cytochrome P460
MAVDKASPLYADLGGMHNVYINTTGAAALKKGGTYPDKSQLVTELTPARRPASAAAPAARGSRRG